MIIYVTRHGRTVWNEKKISQGHSNNMLSETGKVQALEAAEKLKDVKIDIIFSSPLRRTIQTTNIINKYHNTKIVRDRRIIEVDQGDFTGRKYSDLTEYEREQKELRSEKFGMESFDSIKKRVEDFLDDIIKNYYDKTVLIVTHDMVASLIEKILKNETINLKTSDLCLFDNAEVKKFKK